MHNVKDEKIEMKVLVLISIADFQGIGTTYIMLKVVLAEFTFQSD